MVSEYSLTQAAYLLLFYFNNQVVAHIFPVGHIAFLLFLPIASLSVD